MKHTRGVVLKATGLAVDLEDISSLFQEASKVLTYWWGNPGIFNSLGLLSRLFDFVLLISAPGCCNDSH